MPSSSKRPPDPSKQSSNRKQKDSHSPAAVTNQEEAQLQSIQTSRKHEAGGANEYTQRAQSLQPVKVYVAIRWLIPAPGNNPEAYTDNLLAGRDRLPLPCLTRSAIRLQALATMRPIRPSYRR
jgi:hypothetical protein